MSRTTAKTRNLVQLSLLIALEAVMAFTPLGFIMIPPISITILHIPVIIGAILMGPTYGGILGGAFGVLAMIKATFFAAILVVLLSRLSAVWERCPVTIFLISGIFPLVPGGGVYWTAYYIVTNQMELAAQTGFMALKVAVAIVLGIVLVFQLPQKVFHIKNLLNKEKR